MNTINSQFVFCPPPPGKPNPNEPPNPAKTRSRVVQAPQKGHTCLYYALQILRNEKRIGKCALESQTEEREREKALSAHRKQISKIDETSQPLIAFAKETEDFFGQKCNRSLAQDLLNRRAVATQDEHLQRCAEALKAFCAQDACDDFVAYTENERFRASHAVHKQFFKERKASLKSLIKGICEKALNKNWKELNILEKSCLADYLIYSYSMQTYGLKKSAWHPELPIEDLIKHLHLYGPHVMRGRFGQAYYEDDPEEFKQIEARTVFRWPSAAEKGPGSRSCCGYCGR